jgi:predicted PurR-regulated permease PerM
VGLFVIAVLWSAYVAQPVIVPVAVLEEVRKALNLVGSGEPTLKVEQQPVTVVTTIFSILTPAVSQFILFIGALLFYLVYQKRLRSTVVLLLSDREARLATVHR